jgi:tRNA A-37 threonylcarbamoyl transferase component Bud32
VVFETIQGGTALCEETRRIRAIIQALEKLHEDGFVHGDIRGFNTVFRTKEKAGSLTLIWRQGSTTNNCSPQRLQII